jgi:hypothetical protein
MVAVGIGNEGTDRRCIARVESLDHAPHDGSGVVSRHMCLTIASADR